MSTVVLKFCFCGLSVKKAWLRGTDKRYPMISVNVLFMKVLFFSGNTELLHVSAMLGLANNSEWIIENYHSVKNYCEGYRKSTFQQAKSAYESDVEYWEKRFK